MSLRSRYKVFLGSQISKAMFCEILPDVAVHKFMDAQLLAVSGVIEHT